MAKKSKAQGPKSKLCAVEGCFAKVERDVRRLTAILNDRPAVTV